MTYPKLTFLHTSPIHIKPFNRLMAQLAPDISVQHVVDEGLLNKAQINGITAEIANEVQHKIHQILKQATIVLCTCSTIGGCAEQVNNNLTSQVIRVDRPMAEKAVMLGPSIIVVATLASTIKPTTALILEVAQQSKKTITIVEQLYETAWPKFEQGDLSGYHHEIANRLSASASQGQVIVLAQASMAGAIPLCSTITIPILSSPRLGVEAAIKAIRNSNNLII